MKVITASAMLFLLVLISPSEIFAMFCLLALAIIGLTVFCVALGDYEVHDD